MSAPYQALVAKVDAFVARVEARHRDELACAPGCARCCHVRLTVTTAEADALTAWLAAQPDEARAAIAAGARAAAPERCPALDEADRCRIYAARPLVCRSHGVPIRLRRGPTPVVTACELNFTARGPAAADPDCVLDQALVSTTLAAIVGAGGGDPLARVPLVDLLTAG